MCKTSKQLKKLCAELEIARSKLQSTYPVFIGTKAIYISVPNSRYIAPWRYPVIKFFYMQVYNGNSVISLPWPNLSNNDENP